MQKSFIEHLYYLLNECENADDDSKEKSYYWDAIIEFADELCPPEHAKNDISRVLYDLVASFGRAAEIHGFKRGLSFALRLMSEFMHTPEKTWEETQFEHKKIFPEIYEKHLKTFSKKTSR